MPTPIAEGLAVVFGELGGFNFTDIGVSCRSGLCNARLAVLSMPVLTFAGLKAPAISLIIRPRRSPANFPRACE
jgi:hypothetical protein